MKLSDDLRKLVELQLKTLTHLEDCEKNFNEICIKNDNQIASIEFYSREYFYSRIELKKNITKKMKESIVDCFSHFVIIFESSKSFIIRFRKSIKT